MPKDYYAILGVQKGASADELKKAFRRLAHEHHPDKGGDPAKFKDVNEAYQVLGDPEKRKMYDQFGSAAFEQGGMGGGPGGFGGFGGGGFGFDFSQGFQGAGFEDLGDMLGEMFGFGGGGSGRGKQARGQSIEMDVELTFKEAAFGVEKEVKLYKPSTCNTCKGNGAEPGSSLGTCRVCHGQGRVQQAQRTMFGTIQVATTCGTCHGTGKIPEKPCHTCKGNGVERREETLRVRIPAGMESGQGLEVEGAGEAAPHGGRPGNLILRVRVKPDPYLTRDGHDIRSTVTVPFSLLALGGTVVVETLDGKETIGIGEATQPGTVMTLRGKGILYGRGGRGNHYLTITAEMPKKLSREQRELLQSLKEQGM